MVEIVENVQADEAHGVGLLRDGGGDHSLIDPVERVDREGLVRVLREREIVDCVDDVLPRARERVALDVECLGAVLRAEKDRIRRAS